MKKWLPPAQGARSRERAGLAKIARGSDLMVKGILKGQDPSAIGRIIRTAQAKNGDFEAAIVQVTGKDAKAVFQRVLAAHWK